VRFKGESLVTAAPERLRALRGDRIAMIFQDPMMTLNPVLRVDTQMVEAVQAHRAVDRASALALAREALVQVGMPAPERRLKAYPHELSGGMRQRIAIAIAFINKPDLIIADEPTTALDVTIQAQILDLLLKLKDEFNMAMLLITHDLGIVRKMADRVCVMNNGEIVERGATRNIFAKPQHPYTRHLIASEPKGSPPPEDAKAKTILETKDLRVWFPIRRGFLRRTVGYIKAVDGIDLEVKQGQTLGVVGESGSGKTTLGLAVLRLISSDGPIVYLGDRIDAYDSKRMRPLRRHMQIVFQDPYGSLSPRLSVGQIIEEGLTIQNHGLTRAERDARVARALKEVGLDPAMRGRYPHEFSGGQRQRIAIARALVLEPKFLILDEPTSALDVSVQAQIVDLLRDLQRRHKLAYLFISHDLKVVRALANSIVVLRHGKVVEQGPAQTVFAEPKTDYTKALLAAAFELEATRGGAVAT
jgi:microcin C transport system ATP-binding protein